MKKYLPILFFFSSTLCFADPSIIQLNFTCPSTKGNDMFVLSNFGSYIGGYGTELVAGSPAFNTPYFKGTISPSSNIPVNLQKGSYSSSATDFDLTTGLVTCCYTSSTKYDAFSVSYYVTNYRGGNIASQSADKITINQFVGFASSH